MNTLLRLMVFLLTIFWSVVLFWYFGTLYMFLLSLFGLIFLLAGGPKHA